MNYYLRNKVSKFVINFLILAPLIAGTVVLALWKRKKQCIAAGILYLVGGVIVWLYKIIYFIYLILSGKLEKDFEYKYGTSYYLMSFLINLAVIFFRLGAV